MVNLHGADGQSGAEYSAKQGNFDAQINLGHCYKNGEGLKQNDKKANYWYNKAFEKLHIDLMP